MATLTDSLVSSSARKLAIRKRPDLSARRQQYLGQSYWVVKEPVGLNYFRFQEEEYAILQMLDGQVSLDEIKERFEAQFPPQKITLEELQHFLGMLHRSGLVIASVPGQGVQLHKRRKERRKKELIGAATNILCIRFKGFDPERLLNWLYPKCRWFFSTTALVLGCLLALAALSLVLVEFDTFQSRLPAFYRFFSPTNALLLAATLGVIKIFHEFWHGLACKHFGGECHEMGVMILVLTPCLYCNVSDSWMLPSKWHRAAIGAAGMFVEVVIASICTFVWWFSHPGLLNMLCLNAMFVASITTLIFNANPLLRYDGYYILADITEIPNLRQKATTILSHKLGQLCLGLEPPDDPFLPQRNQMFFALYSVAAAAYRWFVMFSIMWFLYSFFKHYKMQPVAHLIIAMSLYGLVVVPLYKMGKFFYVPGRIDKVKKPRMFATLGVLALLLAALFFVPLPHRVTCPLEIELRDDAIVYVTLPEGGRLDEILVVPGQEVREGQLLAVLSSVDVDLEIARLEGQCGQYEAQRDSLWRQSFDDPAALADIPHIEEALEAARTQLEQKRGERETLRLKAPKDGTVLPPDSVSGQTGDQRQLPAWSGTPLEKKNIGCHLEAGTKFCHIGDPKKLQAMLVIDQSDRNFVHGPRSVTKDGKETMTSGELVEIKLDQLAGKTLHGRITEISDSELEKVPQRLSTSAGGELATVTDPATGKEGLQSTAYPAFVFPLEGTDGLLRRGLRGRAKIHTQWEPLAPRIWRFISHTFSFSL